MVILDKLVTTVSQGYFFKEIETHLSHCVVSSA